ncbi:hypothetical protein N0V88_000970 [Collariella sp. IMI 366227]|nr:hypothetical protein N0V88_000970 [Collariella sp. IMI 366227]
MANTGFFHHIGTFLLFSATVLLIITCISAPVVNDLALLKVEFGDKGGRPDGTSISFGTFGYCENRPNVRDVCTRSRVGYNPAAILAATDNTAFSDYAESTTRSLTKVMILHPIACGINFIAFLLAIGAGMVGSFLASLVALLAFLTTAVACVIDFVLWSIVKSNVNDRGEETGTGAYYGPAAWTGLVAAMAMPFLSELARRNRNNLRTLRTSPAAEISGALGDLGTLLPLMIALALQSSIDLSSTLVFSGLFNIITGAIFGIPLPVQPMKVPPRSSSHSNPYSHLASSRPSPPPPSPPPPLSVTTASGALVSLAVLLLSATGALRLLTRLIPVPIIKGIQLGAGLRLVISGANLILPYPGSPSPQQQNLHPPLLSPPLSHPTRTPSLCSPALPPQPLHHPPLPSNTPPAPHPAYLPPPPPPSPPPSVFQHPLSYTTALA